MMKKVIAIVLLSVSPALATFENKQPVTLDITSVDADLSNIRVKVQTGSDNQYLMLDQTGINLTKGIRLEIPTVNVTQNDQVYNTAKQSHVQFVVVDPRKPYDNIFCFWPNDSYATQFELIKDDSSFSIDLKQDQFGNVTCSIR